MLTLPLIYTSGKEAMTTTRRKTTNNENEKSVSSLYPKFYIELPFHLVTYLFSVFFFLRKKKYPSWKMKSIVFREIYNKKYIHLILLYIRKKIKREREGGRERGREKSYKTSHLLLSKAEIITGLLSVWKLEHNAGFFRKSFSTRFNGVRLNLSCHEWLDIFCKIKQRNRGWN